MEEKGKKKKKKRMRHRDGRYTEDLSESHSMTEYDL